MKKTLLTLFSFFTLLNINLSQTTIIDFEDAVTSRVYTTSTSIFESGIYFVSLQERNKIATRKLAKNK